jgi:Cu-processing system ATP-binding protein
MVSIKGLHKKFGKNQVLNGVDLSIGDGGIFAVLGPNGSRIKAKSRFMERIFGKILTIGTRSIIYHK